MGLWESRFLPRMIDRSCGMALLRPLREQATRGLRGRVLEIGYGSGLNNDLYPRAVTEVLAVEPSEEAWRIAQDRPAAVPVRRVGLDGARVDLEEGSVDAVLATFVLCTIPDVTAALNECRRVLAGDGVLHLAEHGLAPQPRVARWQRRLEPLQRRIAGGCHLTRDPRALLAEAGFTDIDLTSGYLDVPAVSRPWSYISVGTAR